MRDGSYKSHRQEGARWHQTIFNQINYPLQIKSKCRKNTLLITNQLNTRDYRRQINTPRSPTKHRDNVRGVFILVIFEVSSSLYNLCLSLDKWWASFPKRAQSHFQITVCTVRILVCCPYCATRILMIYIIPVQLIHLLLQMKYFCLNTHCGRAGEMLN